MSPDGWIIVFNVQGVVFNKPLASFPAELAQRHGVSRRPPLAGSKTPRCAARLTDLDRKKTRTRSLRAVSEPGNRQREAEFGLL